MARTTFCNKMDIFAYPVNIDIVIEIVVMIYLIYININIYI